MKNFSLTDFVITNKFTGKPLQPVILALARAKHYYPKHDIRRLKKVKDTITILEFICES
jgi:hypothetical protein